MHVGIMAMNQAASLPSQWERRYVREGEINLSSHLSLKASGITSRSLPLEQISQTPLPLQFLKVAFHSFVRGKLTVLQYRL